MSDLIRRYDAIVALAQSADYISDALEKLEKVPAVDAVPGGALAVDKDDWNDAT